MFRVKTEEEADAIVSTYNQRVVTLYGVTGDRADNVVEIDVNNLLLLSPSEINELICKSCITPVFYDEAEFKASTTMSEESLCLDSIAINGVRIDLTKVRFLSINGNVFFSESGRLCLRGREEVSLGSSGLVWIYSDMFRFPETEIYGALPTADFYDIQTPGEPVSITKCNQIEVYQQRSWFVVTRRGSQLFVRNPEADNFDPNAACTICTYVHDLDRLKRSC